MKGMEGATAEIDSAKKRRFSWLIHHILNGEKVKNHKWVIEEEISPVE